jgi:uncharacterized SAM-binding protein YcdF (DUF218 family)
VASNTASSYTIGAPRWVRVASALLVLLAALGGGSFLARAQILGWAADQLIRNDAVEPSDVILLLAGGAFGVRALEAADLYHAGLAERIVLSPGAPSPGSAELARRGVSLAQPTQIQLNWFEGLGVPSGALSVLPGIVESTRDEAEVSAAWCDANDIGSVIVVTSAYHTARAGFVFERVFGDRPIRIAVRAAAFDDFTRDAWWKARTTLRTGVFELQRMLFYRLAY